MREEILALDGMEEDSGNERLQETLRAIFELTSDSKIKQLRENYDAVMKFPAF